MLFIKQLVLNNFKSFRKAKLDFVNGTNGIIGPNGSGKSNICDAILFALGENSLSRLRVSKINQLINDAAKKSPTPAASVTLELSADQPIIIKRVLRIDGKTKFYLNGKRITRKALVDFLRPYGVFTDQLNAITQEEVAKVIKLTPKERRKLMDTISGIEEFDQKKDEAMKELEKVQQRLNETNILLNEKQGYLKSLEKEKEQALLYKSLSSKIRVLSQALLNYNKDAYSKELDKISSRLFELESKKKEILSKKEAILKELDSVKKENAELLNEINKLTIERQDFYNKKQAIEKEISLREAEIKNIEESIKKARQKISETEQKIKEASAKYDEILKDLSAKKEKAKEIGIDLNAPLDAISAEDLDSKLREIISEKARLELQLGQKEEEIVSNADKIAAELEAINSEIQLVNSKFLELKKEIESISREKQAIDQKILEEEIKGKGRIYSFLSKKEGVYGTVAEVISFEKDYEKAINACAGSRLNYFIVDNIDTAYNLIKEIDSRKLGWATFIPLKELEYREAEKGSLAEYITFDKKFEKVVNFIFGSTFLSTFDKIKREPGKRYVTKEGVIVESSSIISGGYQEQVNFGELKKKSKELEEKLKAVSSEEEKIRNHLSELEIQKREKEIELSLERKRVKELSEKNEKIKHAKDLAAKRIAELESLEQQLKNKNPLSKEAVQLRVEISSLEAQFNSISEKLDELKSSLALLQKEIKDSSQKIESRNKELESFKSQLETLKYPSEIEPLYKKYQERKKIEDKFAQDFGSLDKEEDFVKNEISQLSIKKIEIETKLKDILSELKSFSPQPNAQGDAGDQKGDVFVISSDEEKRKAEFELEDAKRKLSNLGEVNMLAIQAYDEKLKEVKEVEEKVEKIKSEKEAILQMINEIEEKKIRIFKENFEKVNANFKKLYSLMFNEAAELYLDKPKDIFNSGLYIKVGNVERDEGSFSGGQKTILFLILLFSIHFVKNLPFYLLDEIDSALDKENTKKVVNLIKKISKDTQTQFIVVTHNDLAITSMDAAIGVTFTQKEGSKVYGIILDSFGQKKEVEQQGPK